MSKNINCYIGEVVSGFVRIEFILTEMAYDLGHTNSKFNFFAKPNAEQKLKKLETFIEKSKISNKDEIVSCINEINDIRKERNRVVHSIITSSHNNENFMTFNFNLKENKVKKDIKLLKGDYFENLVIRVREAHNRLHKSYYENQNA